MIGGQLNTCLEIFRPQVTSGDLQIEVFPLNSMTTHRIHHFWTICNFACRKIQDLLSLTKLLGIPLGTKQVWVPRVKNIVVSGYWGPKMPNKMRGKEFTMDLPIFLAFWAPNIQGPLRFWPWVPIPVLFPVVYPTTLSKTVGLESSCRQSYKWFKKVVFCG